MSKLAARIGTVALALAALLSVTPAQALDPITLVVLRMLRDHAISASLEAGVESMRQQQASLPGYANVEPPPAGATEAQRLRTLIDEAFPDLSAAQRDSVHQGLMKMLADPSNAPMRAAIVQEFTAKARALRDSYRLLSNLSDAEKRSISAQAAAEYRKLPDTQRREILDVLQAGVPALPRDLSDMMLSELRSVQ